MAKVQKPTITRCVLFIKCISPTSLHSSYAWKQSYFSSLLDNIHEAFYIAEAVSCKRLMTVKIEPLMIKNGEFEHFFQQSICQLNYTMLILPP